MKTTLKIALLTALFLTPTLADDGQMGSGGRDCPPPCTAEQPEDCPAPCPTNSAAPTEEGDTLVIDALKQIVNVYFVGL